jgi:DNA modification methylase
MATKRILKQHPQLPLDLGASSEVPAPIVDQPLKVASLNGLTPQAWAQLSRNVWADLSSPRSARHIEHGAVFPIKLAERLITMYSKVGDLICEPFAGVGTTLVAACRLNRNSIGAELNPRFAELANEWIAETIESGQEDFRPQLCNEDCRKLLKRLPEAEIQLTVTSPPYANFIQRSVADRAKTHKKSRIVNDNNSVVKAYSDDARDFGNLNYPNFLTESTELFRDLLRATRPGGYAVWIVKDYRLPPDQPYVSLHSDLARAAQDAGWLWHDLIVWDQNEQRRLILLGYPTRFYTNQNCTFIVVLRRREK